MWRVLVRSVGYTGYGFPPEVCRVQLCYEETAIVPGRGGYGIEETQDNDDEHRCGHHIEKEGRAGGSK